MSCILFRNCQYLICHTGPGGVVEDGAVLVRDGAILAVGPSAQIEALCDGQPGLEVVDCRGKLVMPGLVDAHNHLGEAHTLLIPGWLDRPISGIVDATNRIYWPAYGWLSEQSTYDLTLFGLVHSLKHGVTTHSDAMIFPDAIYRASVHAQTRTIIFPQMLSSAYLPDAKDEREYLAHTEAAIQSYHGSQHGTILVGAHPNAIYNCSAQLLTGGMELARRYDVLFATHVAESPDETTRAACVWAREGGLIGYASRLGLLSPRTVLFHGTLLGEAEIDALAATGTALVTCPSTNAWFGYCAYLPYMLEAGLRVGLGTDCVTHNLFAVMLSVLQHHAIVDRPLRGLEPRAIFGLATLGGARVLRLDHLIGTLEPGKRADIISIDLSHNTGLFPVSPEVIFAMLALNGAGAQACDVMVDGVFLRRDGKFTRLDEEAIMARAREWCQKFAADYKTSSRTARPLFEPAQAEFQPSPSRVNPL